MTQPKPDTSSPMNTSENISSKNNESELNQDTEPKIKITASRDGKHWHDITNSISSDTQPEGMEDWEKNPSPFWDMCWACKEQEDGKFCPHGSICTHDEGYACEHRLPYIIAAAEERGKTLGFYSGEVKGFQDGYKAHVKETKEIVAEAERRVLERVMKFIEEEICRVGNLYTFDPVNIPLSKLDPAIRSAVMVLMNLWQYLRSNLTPKEEV